MFSSFNQKGIMRPSNGKRGLIDALVLLVSVFHCKRLFCITFFSGFMILFVYLQI